MTAAQLATSKLQKYRAASRESTSRVTGAISEMFSNVQAIQVAGAEERVINRFKHFNEDRRKTMIKDRLMGEMLDSVFSNSVNIGTGLILLLAGQKMRAVLSQSGILPCLSITSPLSPSLLRTSVNF